MVGQLELDQSVDGPSKASTPRCHDSANLGRETARKKNGMMEVAGEDEDQEQARVEVDPQKSAEYLALKDQVLVSVLRAILSDPDVLVVFSARWPSGIWRRDLYRTLREWQRVGGLRMLLRKLHGLECPVSSDVGAAVHKSSLLLSFGEEDLYWQEADPDFEVTATMDNMEECLVVRAALQRASSSWRSNSASRKGTVSETSRSNQDGAAVGEGQEIRVARRAIEQLACKAAVFQGEGDTATALRADLAALQAELTKLINTTSSTSSTNKHQRCFYPA